MYKDLKCIELFCCCCCCCCCAAHILYSVATIKSNMNEQKKITKWKKKKKNENQHIHVMLWREGSSYMDNRRHDISFCVLFTRASVLSIFFSHPKRCSTNVWTWTYSCCCLSFSMVLGGTWQKKTIFLGSFLTEKLLQHFAGQENVFYCWRKIK